MAGQGDIYRIETQQLLSANEISKADSMKAEIQDLGHLIASYGHTATCGLTASCGLIDNCGSTAGRICLRLLVQYSEGTPINGITRIQATIFANCRPGGHVRIQKILINVRWTYPFHFHLIPPLTDPFRSNVDLTQ